MCFLGLVTLALPCAAQVVGNFTATPIYCKYDPLYDNNSAANDGLQGAWLTTYGLPAAGSSTSFVPNCAGYGGANGANPGIFSAVESAVTAKWGPQLDPQTNITPQGLSALFYNNGQGAYDHAWVQLSNLTLAPQFTVSAWTKMDCCGIGQITTIPTGYPRIVEIGTYAAGVMLGGNKSPLTPSYGPGGAVTSYGSQYQVVISHPDSNNEYGNCQGGNIDGGWHMVTATYDGMDAYLYVDAVKVAGPCPFTFPSAGMTGLSGRIGAYNNSPALPYDSLSGFWYGSIDTVLLYGTALNQSKIQNLYLNGVITP